MGKDSKIEWCDHTYNPWMGCAPVSAGCMNCYAERDMDHRWGKVKWGPRGTRVLTSKTNRMKPFHWNKQAEKDGHVQTVFTASLADVFEDWPSRQGIEGMHEWRLNLFEIMELTPWLVWLVLTKRPQNVLDMVPGRWLEHMSYGNAVSWPANVWIGFSAEDQGNFDFRMDSAIEIPTPVLWVSAEPLLGSIDMYDLLDLGHVNWVIAGGESGPKARPSAYGWFNSLREQCYYTGVPFFFKQWGEWISEEELHNNTGLLALASSDYQFAGQESCYRVGRKRAGRLLNNQEYNELPAYLDEYEQELLES